MSDAQGVELSVEVHSGAGGVIGPPRVLAPNRSVGVAPVVEDAPAERFDLVVEPEREMREQEPSRAPHKGQAAQRWRDGPVVAVRTGERLPAILR